MATLPLPLPTASSLADLSQAFPTLPPGTNRTAPCAASKSRQAPTQPWPGEGTEGRRKHVVRRRRWWVVTRVSKAPPSRRRHGTSASISKETTSHLGSDVCAGRVTRVNDKDVNAGAGHVRGLQTMLGELCCGEQQHRPANTTHS